MKRLAILVLLATAAMSILTVGCAKKMTEDQAREAIEKALVESDCYDTKSIGPWMSEQYDWLEERNCLTEPIDLKLSAWGRKVFHWGIDPTCGNVLSQVENRRWKGASFQIRVGRVGLLQVLRIAHQSPTRAYVEVLLRMTPNPKTADYPYSMCAYKIGSEPDRLSVEETQSARRKFELRKFEETWRYHRKIDPPDVPDILK